MLHSAAMALAESDLPQPCTPSSSSPFGGGRPKARASAESDLRRSASHCLRTSRPPTSVSPASSSAPSSMQSSAELRRRSRRFSARIVECHLALGEERHAEDPAGLLEPQPARGGHRRGRPRAGSGFRDLAVSSSSLLQLGLVGRRQRHDRGFALELVGELAERRDGQDVLPLAGPSTAASESNRRSTAVSDESCRPQQGQEARVAVLSAAPSARRPRSAPSPPASCRG